MTFEVLTVKKYLRERSTSLTGVIGTRVGEYTTKIEWEDTPNEATEYDIVEATATQRQLKNDHGMDTELVEIPRESSESRWVISRNNS